MDVREEEHTSLYSDVLKTTDYQWLISQLQRELRLVIPTEADVTTSIRQAIKAALPPIRRVSSKVSPGSYLVELQLDWDIFGFFETQGYTIPPDEAFNGVITLTRSDLGAQATSTSQYIRQTWPTGGEECSKILKETLRLGKKGGK